MSTTPPRADLRNQFGSISAPLHRGMRHARIAAARGPRFAGTYADALDTAARLECEADAMRAGADDMEAAGKAHHADQMRKTAAAILLRARTLIPRTVGTQQ